MEYDIRFYKDIDVVNPVMIAAWPGMGNVALGTADYIRRKMRAVRFAQVLTDPLATLDAVEVRGGVSKLPKAPLSTFYYTKNPDLIIFEGEVQLPGRNGIDLLNKVLHVAADFKVSRIFTGAALPMPISYKDASLVYAAANKELLRDYLKDSGISVMDRGHISGLNGLMLGFAAKKGIDAVCLLATMPQYAIGLPNPKASSAIIDCLNKILNISIDVRELGGYVKDMEDRMAVIEDKVKDVLTIEEPLELYPRHEKKVPGYIMERIEKLFVEAKEDRNKASSLKGELDRWDLYGLYEDRFLDLFKKNQ
ncbi:MAG: PAC2 family protein [Candidatus Omnitrophota bacterium]|nr:PAC2 family protein [Candidatus Omnitrophota bacterium]